MTDKSPDAFRTISEVAEWLGVQPHVLRFWESKFSQVKPVKRAGGRRYYRPNDMLLLGGIRKLLHEDGLTIRGAQKVLREEGTSHVASLSQPLDSETEAMAVEAGAFDDVAPEVSAPPPEPAPAPPEPTPPQPAPPVASGTQLELGMEDPPPRPSMAPPDVAPPEPKPDPLPTAQTGDLEVSPSARVQTDLPEPEPEPAAVSEPQPESVQAAEPLEAAPPLPQETEPTTGANSPFVLGSENLVPPTPSEPQTTEAQFDADAAADLDGAAVPDDLPAMESGQLPDLAAPPEPMADTSDQGSDLPEPSSVDAEPERPALPGFLRHSAARTSEPTQPVDAGSADPQPGDLPAAPAPDLDNAVSVDTAPPETPAPAEVATAPTDPVPAPEPVEVAAPPPRAREVDAPDPIESALQAEPSVLSASLSVSDLSDLQRSELTPLVVRLAALRDRMAASRNT